MSLKNVLVVALFLVGCGGSAQKSSSDMKPAGPNACIGVECAPPTECQNPGVCDPSTGACTYSPRPDGQVCSDGNVCTLNDSCKAGVCVGGTTETCAAADQCHAAGTCDPVKGCSNATEPDGAPCDDGNLCTQSDVCTMGICAGSMLSCTGGTACAPTGTCNSGTGQCAFQAAPEGTACTLDSGTPSTCHAGTCQSSCPTGFTDCNQNLATDGCEVFTGGDPTNCGGCGQSCSTTNVAKNVCTGGTCQPQCAPGFADCTSTARTTGCETNLKTDALNCGGCGIACFHNGDHGVATSSCSTGKCQGTCSTGYADCNNDVGLDGCEINLNADANNCGRCGRMCPSGMPCVNGGCLAGSYTMLEAPTADQNPDNISCSEACREIYGYPQTPDGTYWDFTCSTIPDGANGLAHEMQQSYNTTTHVGTQKCIVVIDTVAGFNWYDWTTTTCISAFVNDPSAAFDSCRTVPNYCFATEGGGPM